MVYWLHMAHGPSTQEERLVLVSHGAWDRGDGKFSFTPMSMTALENWLSLFLHWLAEPSQWADNDAILQGHWEQ